MDTNLLRPLTKLLVDMDMLQPLANTEISRSLVQLLVDMDLLGPLAKLRKDTDKPQPLTEPLVNMLQTLVKLLRLRIYRTLSRSS